LIERYFDHRFRQTLGLAEQRKAFMQLEPEHPHDAGVEEQIPDLSYIEGAELLANETRQRLTAQGFTDDEIDEWAMAYIAEKRSGDAGSFLAWMAEKESGT
jgi:hypothetical protein